MLISKLMKALHLTDIKATDENGNTALHLTINVEELTEKGIVNIFQILLNEDIDPNAKNNNNLTVLHFAVAYKMKDVVDCLLDHKINIDSVAHFYVENEHAIFRDFSIRYSTIDVRQKIESESASFVEWLISRGFDFDRKNIQSQSALHLAIEYNLQHILPILLRYTKDINYVDEKKRTLLHLFLKKNSEALHTFVDGILENSCYSNRYIIDIVQILLDRGVPADAVDSENWTAVQRAFQYRDFAIVEMLLDRSTKINHKHNRDQTLLQMVLEYVNCIMLTESRSEYFIKMLRSLITKGANINELNEPDDHGYSPLCHVVVYQNMQLINFLEDNGADFSFTTKDGKTLLHVLALGTLYIYTLEKVTEKQVALFNLLFSKGCSVNAKDENGNTPLHDAVTGDNLAIARELIEHGAEVNCERNDGMTPLHIAVKKINTPSKINTPMMELLQKNGANFNAKTKDGKTVMYFIFGLRGENFTQMFNLLVSGGGLLNVKDKTGNSPLHLAAKYADVTIARTLIDFGANINCTNDEKETPLHFATDNREASKMLNCLLEHRANMDAKDSKGRTTLHKIVMDSTSKGCQNALWAFIRYGANLYAQDENGLSVLSYARIRDSHDHEQQCRDYVERYNEAQLEMYYDEKIIPRFLWGLYNVEDSPPEPMTIANCPLEKETNYLLRMLIDHFIELKAANLLRDQEANSFLEALPPLSTADRDEYENHWHNYSRDRHYEECLAEIEKLKNTYIDDRTSLFTFMHTNPTKRCTFINNKKLKDIIERLEFNLVSYTHVIFACYHEAVTRKSLLDPAKEAWMQLTKNALPDLCVECIFSFLSNADLFNIIEKD